MATRNNPMAGRYFNDPNLAVAMSSLASAFAPPGAEDYLVAEKIRGTRTQNDALMDLYTGANGNLDVLGGVAAGGWTPNQGFENFREQNANERRGQDIASGDRRFATEVGSADNRYNTQAGLVEGMMDPNGRNVIDPAYLEAIFGPGAPAMTSAGPVAPSETQVRGRLVQEGGMHLNADDIYALTMEGVPTTEIVDPATGQPRLTFGPLGAREGATPFVNKGAEAAAKPIILVDPLTGEQVGGVFRDGQYFLQDGSAAPANLVPQNLPSATGSADQLGGTTANKSRYDQTRAAAAETRLLVNDLRGLVQSQAGAAGVVGTFQMLGQDFVQTGRELASALSQDPNTDGIVSPEMLGQLNAMGQSYDPVFREIRAGMLQLAYNNARLNNPSGEVSRFALEREMEALGQGMLGNDQSVLAALDMVERNVTRKEAAAQALLGGEVPAIPAYTPGVNAVPGAGPAPTLQPGTVEDGFRYIGGDPANPNSWEPVQ